jgi:hypothetical protein
VSEQETVYQGLLVAAWRALLSLLRIRSKETHMADFDGFVGTVNKWPLVMVEVDHPGWKGSKKLAKNWGTNLMLGDEVWIFRNGEWATSLGVIVKKTGLELSPETHG